MTENIKKSPSLDINSTKLVAILKYLKLSSVHWNRKIGVIACLAILCHQDKKVKGILMQEQSMIKTLESIRTSVYLTNDQSGKVALLQQATLLLRVFTQGMTTDVSSTVNLFWHMLVMLSNFNYPRNVLFSVEAMDICKSFILNKKLVGQIEKKIGWHIQQVCLIELYNTDSADKDVDIKKELVEAGAAWYTPNISSKNENDLEGEWADVTVVNISDATHFTVKLGSSDQEVVARLKGKAKQINSWSSVF